jgi:LysR family transcriptional regulator, hydrogen peroxide-inducible genes activator
MEIRQLRYFCAVAETGSFTRGARREHVSQPSLSEQIKMLEIELGSDLFDRLGQATKLTPTGKTLYRSARSVLSRLGEVKSQIQHGRNMQGGDVTVGAPPTVAPYFLPRALVSFKRKHPLIRLRVIEEPSDQLLQDLRSAAVDLAVLQVPVSGSEFTSEEVAREPLYLAMPRNHRFATRKTVHLAELKEDPFIMLKDGPFRKLVLDALRNARLRPRVVCEAHSFATVLAMVSAGLGVSIIPRMAIEKKGGCAFAALQDEPRTRVIALVRLKRHSVSPAHRLLVEHLERISGSKISSGR